ncbi:MAG: hypothetical protein HY826_04765 [Actinobacteria bacterium]|nr:hypothetical protein [Actinomycetota bacterium]
MGSFLSLWAVLNTMVLTAVIPIEHLAPSLMASRDRAAGHRSVFAHTIVLAAASTVLALVINILTSGDGPGMLQLAGAAFGIALGVWSGRRAGLVGGGEFRRVRHRSITNLAVASVGLGALLFVPHANPALLFLPAALGNLLGAARNPGHGSEVTPQSGAPGLRLLASEYRLLGAMVGATFVTLALTNGSIVLGRTWGVDAGNLVAYAGLLNLVRVPYTLLNNVMAPLNLRFVHLVRTSKTTELAATAVKASVALLGAIGVTALGSAALGPTALGILTGGKYGTTTAFAAGVALAEGAVWLTVIPRLVGSALGVTRPMIISWGIGIAVFSMVAVLPIEGSHKVVIAPLAASAVISGIALPWTLRLARRSAVVISDA